MGESITKALRGRLSGASKASILHSGLGVFLLAGVALASSSVRADPTRMGFLVGTSSDLSSNQSALWNRLELEQGLGEERFFVGLDLQFQSLLSSARSTGFGFGGGMNFSLGSSFEWAPSLRVEQDVSSTSWEPVVQSSVRFQLWSLLFDTQIGFAPFPFEDEQMFRYRQSIGVSLGTTPSREDFVSLDLEFLDRIASLNAPAVRVQLRRVGVQFTSKVEF